MHASTAAYTGDALHDTAVACTVAVVYRNAVVHASTAVYTGDVLHEVAAVYTGAAVYRGAVAHAGTVVYTGAAVQIATYMLFLPVLGRP